MKAIKRVLVTVFIFSIQHSFAQVGIGNTNPQAALDIEASSTTSPADNDGILIPRMSNFPSAPGATRDGMLIFYTGATMSGKGFYYWDDTSGNWSLVGGAKRINDLIDGKTDSSNTSVFLGNNAGAIDDDTNNYNTGLGNGALASNTSGGQNVANGPFTLSNNSIGDSNIAIGFLSLGNNISGNGNTAIGVRAHRYSNTGSSNIAIGSSALNTNNSGDDNIAIGSSSLTGSTTASSNIGIGHSSGSNESGSNKLYIENSNANANNALIYGEFDNDILRTNSEFQIGNPTLTGYAFPTTDGTANQIMATDGSGVVSFVDTSSIFTDTDNQNISGSGFSGTDLTIGIENGTSEVVDLSSLSNTLDQAYNQGGSGAGRTITSDNGAVIINGTDGLLVTGTFDSGNSIDTEVTGAGTRLFFNPNESVFRAGTVDSNQWSSSNNGVYSVAMGENTTAAGSHSLAIGENSSAALSHAISIGEDNTSTGYHAITLGRENTASESSSTAIGWGNTASGIGSLALGVFNESRGYAETTIGQYSTNYTPSGVMNSATDRIFSIGNGLSNAARSNALIIYKNGLMNINDEYDMPLTDGTANQIMATDGGGVVSFVDVSSVFTDTDDQNISGSGLSGSDLTIGIENGTSEVIDLSSLNTGGDITGVTAGAGLSGGGTTGTIIFTAAANNGLNVDAGSDRIQWGGALTEDTNIDYGNFDTRFNLNGNGDFIIQDTGSGVFIVDNAGNSTVGRNMTWRESSIAGTTIAQMLSDGNDGRFIIRENGNIVVDLRANTEFVFNQQGADRNFRVESDGNTNMLLVNAGNNSVGIGGDPDTDFHIYHTDTAASAGFKLQNQGANNNWWRMFASNATGNLFLYSTSGGATPRGNFNNATGVYSATSDRRLKKDFKELPFSWQNFMNLETLSYLYKIQKDDKRSLGLIAQDVELIYPELVTYNTESDVYHMNYSGFGVVAIKAVQELKGEVDSLKEENQKLKAQLSKYESLETRLSALENTSANPSANAIAETIKKE